MVYSMTGFASATATLKTSSGPLTTTITIKTLNNRFFDMNCKLPYALTQLEVPIIKRCREELHRGTVYCTVHVHNPQALKSAATPSLSLAHGYLKSITQLQKELNIPGTITISDFIQMPHLFETTEELQLTDSTQTIMSALDELLTKLKASRALEGKALADDLRSRMSTIEHEMTIIEPRATQVGEERLSKLLQAIEQELQKATQEAKDAHLQALYENIEKIDVHEEIVRFTNHLQNFKRTIDDDKVEKGKKLEFILQEMLREINTLSAKLADPAVSSSIVAIKVELEKAREQAQNIV